MRSFFNIRQVFANAVDHLHNESAIIHIQPVGAADELIGAAGELFTADIGWPSWASAASRSRSLPRNSAGRSVENV